METETGRTAELEALISRLRHDLRGAISPAALVADRLQQNADPAIQRAGARIAGSVQRVLQALDETYQLVPARSASKGGIVLGAGGRQA